MSYSDFTLASIQQNFDLTIIENQNLFSNTTPAVLSHALLDNLAIKVPLALAINTEKARSELIIADVLIELKRQLNNQVSLFSGIRLDVDQTRSLSGFCDFIISKSSEQFFLKAPIITIVEAKNENIPSGIGQCMAEMIAAKLFNEQAEQAITTLFGAVTTGNLWKFLKFHDNTIYIDQTEYHISDSAKIVGILVDMVSE